MIPVYIQMVRRIVGTLSARVQAFSTSGTIKQVVIAKPNKWAAYYIFFHKTRTSSQFQIQADTINRH